MNLPILLLILSVMTIMASGCQIYKSKKDIEERIHQFENGVRNKDPEAMRLLFLDGASWLVVASDRDILSGAHSKDAPKINNHELESFLGFLSITPKSTEVKFSACDIQTDGEIGAVVCSYEFSVDKKMTNSGKEAFLFVRGDKGWKISDMVFSSFIADEH